MSLILGILDSGGAAAGAGGSYESIATVTVGSGGAANIEFTSIPSTYTHLQIRGIQRTTDAGVNGTTILMRFNSDTSSNYSRHLFRTYFGASSGIDAGADVNNIYIPIGAAVSNGLGASIFAGIVIDILDYGNTNKYKTSRNLNGYDFNGSVTGYSYLQFVSGNWRSTSAITSITFTADVGNFGQYTQFALYGIKGA
jgi:hypothetical protein